MNEINVLQRLEQIEGRLSQIEAALDLSFQPARKPTEHHQSLLPRTPLVPRLDAGREDADESRTDDARAQASPISEVHPDPVIPPPLPRFAPVASLGKAVPPIAVIPYLLPKPKPPKQPPLKNGTLEQTIGLKWAGWIGAVVLVIGAGLGIKFGYDQGWFGGLPASVRLSLVYLTGFGLIGLGECVYRRINILSAVGLYGAGVAVLFLVSYAGHAYYGLYEPNTAFAFMALSTLVGAAVAMRGNLVSIAVMALIGGNLAPALIRGNQAHLTGFLCYLLMLQVVSLVLAWWGTNAKWWTLRGLSLVGTALWMTGLLLTKPFGVADAPLWFSLVYAGLYQGELILSSLKKKRLAPTRKNFDEAKIGPQFSLVVTTATMLVVLFLFRESSDNIRALWVLTFAAITGLLAFVLARETAEPITLKYLSIGYAIQTAALLALVIPVAFSGIWISAGWTILAIAFAAAAMLLDLPIARYSAAITWGLSIAALDHWVQAGPNGNHLNVMGFTLFGHGIATYAIMGWALSIGGHAVASLIVRGERSGRDWVDMLIPRIISWAACILWVFVSLCALSPLGATVMLVAYAWLLAAADMVEIDFTLLPQAAAVLTFVTMKWIVLDTLQHRLTPGWTPGNEWPILNPLMGSGVLIAGSLVGIYRLRRQRILNVFRVTDQDVSTNRLMLVAAIFLLMTFGFSMEIDRVVEHAVRGGSVLVWSAWQLKQMAWTLLGTLAVLLFAAAVVKLETRPTYRRDWLGRLHQFIAILALKYFLVDTLLFRFQDGPVIAAAVFNTQLFTGLVVAAALVFIRLLGRGEDNENGINGSRLSFAVYFVALLVLLWTGTMEIDRLAERFFVGGSFPLPQLKNLLWTCWWTMGITGFLFGIARFGSCEPRGRTAALNRYWPVMALLAVKYLLVDTALWRVLHNPARVPVLMNIQVLTAAMVLAGLIVLLFVSAMPMIKDGLSRLIQPWTIGLSVLVLLWNGTLEIDRAFHLMAATNLSEQMALSIFWSLFAILSVLFGFRTRLAGLRYFGLSLFAITLVKVVAIDLSQIGTGYRILSFIGLGLLLLGTSVLYGKLSPVLLRNTPIGDNKSAPL